MRKMLAFLLVICLLMLCACDSTESMNSDGGEPVHKGPAYIGRWESEHGILIFTEDERFYQVRVNSNELENFEKAARGWFWEWYYDADPDSVADVLSQEEVEIPQDFDVLALTLKYDPRNVFANTMAVNETVTSGEAVTGWISVDVTGDELATGNYLYTRSNIEAVQHSVVGTWHLVGYGDFEDIERSYAIGDIHTFHFYDDGTFHAEWTDGDSYEDYDMMNNGKVLRVDNRVCYECNLLGYGLMELVSSDGVSMLYVMK